MKLLIADRDEVENPKERIRAYIAAHPKTVRGFDLVCGTSPDKLTEQLVAATRRPFMNSRITLAEAKWFVETAKKINWALLPEDANLADADPLVEGGLYDTAGLVHSYFRNRKDVGPAKIHKVLHAMRPHLFPILDGRLRTLYASKASRAARDLHHARPDYSYRRAYWAAIRDDVVEHASVWQAARSALAEGSDMEAVVGERVGDVRLLDMICWSIG